MRKNLSLDPIQVPTPEEAKLLRHLSRVRVSYAAELAEMCGVSSKYASSMITRLRRKGLVAVAGDSRGSPGKRRVFLEITDSGRIALDAISSGRPYQVVRAFKTKEGQEDERNR